MITKSLFAGAISRALAFVADLSRSDDQELDADRPLLSGSDRIGEYNFRARALDSGADPEGWYEEDF